MKEEAYLAIIGVLGTLLLLSVLERLLRRCRRGTRVRAGGIAATAAYKPDTFLLGNLQSDSKDQSTIFVIPEKELRRSVASLASLAETDLLTSSSSGLLQSDSKEQVTSSFIPESGMRRSVASLASLAATELVTSSSNGLLLSAETV